jgi:hypothetical protein
MPPVGREGEGPYEVRWPRSPAKVRPVATSVITIESPAAYQARSEPSFESATAWTVLALTATGGATSRIRSPVPAFQT